MVVCSECSNENIKAISISRCVDGDVEREQALLETEKRQETINALADICTTIVELDIPTREYLILKNEVLVNNVLKGKRRGIFDDGVENVVQYFIVPEMQDTMRAFFNIDTLAARLEKQDTVAADYKSKQGRWFRSRFIAKKSEGGHVTKALFVARDITAETEKEQHYLEQLKAAA